MAIMGIKFKRKFNLESMSVKNVIDNDIYISFYDDKIQLPLSKIRNNLKYFPVKKNGTLEFRPSNPLMTVIKKNGMYMIHYGNRKLANLKPDYLDLVNEEKIVSMNIDDEKQNISLGSIVQVKNSFVVNPLENFRVNVIGFTQKGKRNEAGLKVRENEIQKRYSVDKNGKVFRVEFYKDDKFAGMVLVNFSDEKKSSKTFSVASNKDKSASTSL